MLQLVLTMGSLGLWAWFAGGISRGWELKATEENLVGDSGGGSGDLMLIGTWKEKTVPMRFYKRTRSLLGRGLQFTYGNNLATLFSVMSLLRTVRLKVINLVEKFSLQSNIQAVAWLLQSLLAIFTVRIESQKLSR